MVANEHAEPPASRAWERFVAEAERRGLTPDELADERMTHAPTPARRAHIGHAEARCVWARIRALPLTSHALEDGPAMIDVARRLERTSAYDAAYIVLAQRLGTHVWTLDRRLAHNARTRNLPVRLIEGGG